jgi:hypothetical protein
MIGKGTTVISFFEPEARRINSPRFVAVIRRGTQAGGLSSSCKTNLLSCRRGKNKVMKAAVLVEKLGAKKYTWNRRQQRIQRMANALLSLLPPVLSVGSGGTYPEQEY